MSKFASMLNLLDKKNLKIKKRDFPKNVRPFHDQEVCWVPIKLPELKSQCADCRFHDIVTTQGKVNEFGIDGYMTNQKDPLEPTKLNLRGNVLLREPRAIIIAYGEVHCCRHRRREGSFFLMENEAACEHFDEKKSPKKTKAK